MIQSAIGVQTLQNQLYQKGKCVQTKNWQNDSQCGLS